MGARSAVRQSNNDGQANPALSGRNARVWAVVCAIPSGKVATYKQVAALAHIEGPSGARQVGYALAALKDGATVPWHRVVNVKGTISPRGDRDWSNQQYDRLALEGIEFDALGRIDLQRFEWHYGD